MSDVITERTAPTAPHAPSTAPHAPAAAPHTPAPHTPAARPRLDYVPAQHAALTNAEIIPMSLRTLHFVLPAGVDDLARPSGGNAYDRRICLDLPGFGWQVVKHTVGGDWPEPGAEGRAALARTLGELPDDTVVLLDGLVACGVPEVIVPEAGRLRLAVLVHLPLGDETGLEADVAAALDAKERETLRAVSAVIGTSDWAVRRLVSHHGLAPERVHVAAPGADIAPSPPAPTASPNCCASPPSPRARGSTGWSRRSPPPPTCPGPACASARSRRTPSTSPGYGS